MKKLNILLLSALSLGMIVTSCSKDDAKEPSAEGKWTFDKSVISQGGTAGAEQAYNDADCPNKNYLDLKAGGVIEEGYVGHAAADKSDDKCTFTKFPGTWKIENNVLKIEEGDYKMNFNVVSITATKMTLKVTSKDDATKTLTLTLLKS